MEPLYNKNGLMFWNQREIESRKRQAEFITSTLTYHLREINRAFDFIQIEAPLLTPVELINSAYSPDDYYKVENDLVLRPETTMGSYQYALWLKSHGLLKLPLVVWQHGPSFRKEQDQVTKNMRLKQFNQLEFQIIYGLTTAKDYAAEVIPLVCRLISISINSKCYTELSDRLPNYSEITTDVIHDETKMELASISLRKDFPDAKCLEVAIGTDRLVYQSTTNNPF